nr:LysR family transcriptional regulator [Epibacterium ulvae]
METFVWVARLNSFRAAAEKLNVSQATISSRIATLESELQCRLFDRDRNDVAVSAQGSALLQKALNVLQAEQELKNALSEPQDMVGRVRVGIIESIVHTWMGQFLNRISQSFPKLEFELTVESTPNLQGLLQRGSLDVVLQTETILDENVLNATLSPLRLGWACSKDHPLCEQPVTLKDIADHQIVTFTRGSRPHLSVLTLFENANLSYRQIHCVTSLAAIAQFVRAGLGVATVPTRFLEDGQLGGEFRLLDVQDAPPPLNLVASWHREASAGAIGELVQIAEQVSREYAARIHSS